MHTFWAAPSRSVSHMRALEAIMAENASSSVIPAIVNNNQKDRSFAERERKSFGKEGGSDG